MASMGQMDIFDDSLEDWSTYFERLQQYFIFRDIEEVKQVAALLSSIGGKTYSLLRDLVSPAKPADKSLEFLNELLEKHLCPKPLVIAERFRFHKREQLATESVTDYFAILKKLSRNCNFGTHLNDALRDRFVCGIRKEAIQKRLLSEDGLNHSRALEIAVAMETASRDAFELQGKKEGHVNKMKVQANRNFHKEHSSKSAQSACTRCGNRGHSEDKCRFKDALCRNCNQKGHIARVCSEKPKSGKSGKFKYGKSKKSVHAVEGTDSDSEVDLAYVNKVSSGSADPIYLTPIVNGKPLKMELDTGAAISLISLKDYQKHFPTKPLLDSNIVLKTYTGERIRPIGKVNVSVEINDTRAWLDLTVIDRGGPALFGRDWLRMLKLDWKEIKAVKIDKSSVSNKLQELCDKHSEIFKDGIGTLTCTKAKLHLIDHAKPKFCKPRNVPYSLRPKVEAELERLEAEGILSRVAISEWATPIVPIVKKSGDVRICGDFKVTVNPQLVVDQHPLPKMEDICANLAGGIMFSKIDLKNAYLQMEVEPDSKELLTINTHKGLFRYNRLVFGIASAPAIWQRTIEQVLQNIPMTQVILDDMIVSGRQTDEHLQNLQTVMQRLEQNGLRVNKDKCDFFKERIEYCGHVIDKDGLHKSPDKVQAISEAPQPQNVTQVRSYLGLINYYHKFLPNLSTVVHPLNRLLEGARKFDWTSECEEAFKKSKELIMSDRVLAHYDPDKPLRVASDASPHGIGAVMSHVFPDGTERPIAFASRSLNKAERNYSQIDKEALGIVWSVKKFHTYLYGRHFTLITDHQPLVSIFSPEKSLPAMTAARLQRYAVFLAGHNYDIEYRNTKLHGNADGLSRLPLEVPSSREEDTTDFFFLNQIETLPVTTEQIRNKTRRDPLLSSVLDITLQGWTDTCPSDELKVYFNRRRELSVFQGCIMWGLRVVVPPCYQKRCMEELHVGHIGVTRMKALARSYIWWPGIDAQIEQVTKSCQGCSETRNKPPTAPLHPWTWPTTAWQRIHIDFAGPFMKRMFFIIVDAHSKWPEVCIMKSTTAEKTVQALREIFSRNGIPDQIVSDNGPQFISEEFKKFTQANGIKHTFSAPYKPSTNGLAERFVQSFKNSLKSEKKELTVQHKLANFLLAYRNTPHSTTGETPALLMHGRRLRSRLDLLKPDIQRKVQAKQASQMHGTARVFEPGHHVLYRSYRNGEKWICGTVLEQTGPVSYKVNGTNGTIVRKHVDQMLDNSVSSNSSETVPDLCSTPEIVVTPDEPQLQPELEPSSNPSVSLHPASSETASSDIQPTTPVPAIEPDIEPRRNPVRQRRPPDRLNI